ncbi:signal recognition particle subunit [Trapelia coarctata]|nr:signal recognition particle subunit [Trapelia coarctata]
MSRNARIEEVSDSDLDSDPSDMDPEDFAPTAMIRPANIPSSTRTAPAAAPQTQPQTQFRGAPTTQATSREVYKTWQCLYPVYFDSSRSRAEGRRVGKELAVSNPLASEIATAVASLGLQVMLDAWKRHPKDWANPGRVKVCLKEGKGGPMGVKNKHHLYILVSKYLQEHPVTEQTPFKLRLHEVPMPQKPMPPPAIPKGWKMNTVLPLHSHAGSGGGVSENIFKDLMQEMQGGGGAGMPPGMTPGMLEGLAGGASPAGEKVEKKKKEKKKGKA